MSMQASGAFTQALRERGFGPYAQADATPATAPEHFDDPPSTQADLVPPSVVPVTEDELLAWEQVLPLP